MNRFLLEPGWAPQDMKALYISTSWPISSLIYLRTIGKKQIKKIRKILQNVMEQFVHFLSVFNLAACSWSKGNITFQVSTSSNYFEFHSWESRIVCRVRGRFFCSSPVKWARGWIASTMFGLSLGLVRYAKAKGKPVFVCINQMTTRGHRVWVLKIRRSSSFINVFLGQPRGRRRPGGGEDRTRACGLGQRDGETQVGCYLHVHMACSWLETVLMGMETEAFLLIDKPECRQALLFQASDHLCCSRDSGPDVGDSVLPSAAQLLQGQGRSSSGHLAATPGTVRRRRTRVLRAAVVGSDFGGRHLYKLPLSSLQVVAPPFCVHHLLP